MVGGRVSQAVNRRDGGDDDRVLAFEQRLGRGQPHLLDVLVDRGIFLYIGVGRRDIGLRLIVVIIGYEVLDGVLREKIAHLRVQLGG